MLTYRLVVIPVPKRPLKTNNYNMTNEERRLKFAEIRKNLEEMGLLTKKNEIN